MLRCTNCGVELIGDEQFCPNCGLSLERKDKSTPNLKLGKGKLPAAPSKNYFLLIILAILAFTFLLFLFLYHFEQPPGDAEDDIIYTDETIIVGSKADSGINTLRWAIEMASSGDTIIFDPNIFPPQDPAIIYLQSELPDLACGNLTIDASNAGVILDGSKIFAMEDRWTSGLNVNSDKNIVMGLQIANFSPACGISLSNGAKYNMIGGDPGIGSGPLGQGNLIGNVNTGIALQGEGTSFNTVTGNIIGIGPTGAKAWTVVGVHILEGSCNNIIGPDNTIVYSDNCGIQVWGSSAFGNTLTQNSIFNNTWLGIELWEGGNTGLAAPRITFFDLDNGTVQGTACQGCTVEIFSDRGREGEIYEGKTIADQNGNFSFSAGRSLEGPNLTATATDSEGNTSEFSAPAITTFLGYLP